MKGLLRKGGALKEPPPFWSTNGWYAYYWNAFLLNILFVKWVPCMKRQEEMLTSGRHSSASIDSVDVINREKSVT